MPEAPVYVALGSNLGDRADNLRRAVLALGDSVAIERVSSIWLTEPVGIRDQPAFYNAAIGGRSRLAPRALLDALLEVERRLGRVREAGGARMGPRTIDLDLLIHDGLEVDEPGLVVPHPRMKTRRFVLAPLAEIAPELRVGSDPRTVADMLAELPPDDGAERIDVEGWPPEVR